MADLKYHPNFQNLHVQKRLTKVLDWAAPLCVGSRGVDDPVPLSARILNEVFGPKGNDLGDYLRGRLLRVVDASYSNRKSKPFSKRYRLMPEAFNELVSMQSIGAPAPATAYVDTSRALERLVQTHAAELQGLVFQYKDASSRLWHPLQNLRRGQKQPFWERFGLPFDYDIQACAPTILFEMARQTGRPMVLLENLKSYLDDRSDFRTHVATLAGLDGHAAKRLINSLFNGARLGKNTQFSAYQLVDFDETRMDALKNDRRVARLVTEIRGVWRSIVSSRAQAMRPSLTDFLEAGREGRKIEETWKLRTSRAKWGVYFAEERRVLDAITVFLAARHIRVFTEHDGFRTDIEVDLTALEAHVQAVTGYSLKIEQK